MRLVAVVGGSDRAPAPLAVADRHQLALFDTWASGFLDEVSSYHRAVLTSYVRWAQRRRLSRHAATGTLGSWSTLGSRQQITQAAALLDWLDARHVSLAELDQTLLDAWIAGGTTTRTHSSTSSPGLSANASLGAASASLTRNLAPPPRSPPTTTAGSLPGSSMTPRSQPRPRRWTARHALRPTRQPHRAAPATPPPHHKRGTSRRARLPADRSRLAA